MKKVGRRRRKRKKRKQKEKLERRRLRRVLDDLAQDPFAAKPLWRLIEEANERPAHAEAEARARRRGILVTMKKT